MSVSDCLAQGGAEKCGWTEPKVLTRLAGAALEFAVFRHPFLDRDSLGRNRNIADC